VKLACVDTNDVSRDTGTDGIARNGIVAGADGKAAVDAGMAETHGTHRPAWITSTGDCRGRFPPHATMNSNCSNGS
jgi:hypothetical protein